MRAEMRLYTVVFSARRVSSRLKATLRDDISDTGDIVSAEKKILMFVCHIKS